MRAAFLILAAATVACAQMPGETRVNPRDGQTYVWVPPGSFTMGCSPADGECFDEEKPPYKVTLTRGFWLGQTEVPVGAWKKYAESQRRPLPPEPKLGEVALNPSWADEDQPMVNVTWNEAAAYCRWTGGRLPTEPEWEYAARAGTKEPRYGDLDTVAWSADNSGREHLDSASILAQDRARFAVRLEENANRPQHIRLKAPNAWGLYDMLGSVWEWTATWYGFYPAEDVQDPEGPESGQSRVLRGGSWYSYPRVVRASNRLPNEPGIRSNVAGFRCVGP